MKSGIFYLFLFLLVGESVLHAQNKDLIEDVQALVIQHTEQTPLIQKKKNVVEKKSLQKLSLEETIALALQANPSIQQTLQEVLLSKSNVRQEGLVENPEVVTSFAFPHEGDTKVVPKFSLSQNVLDFYLASLRKKLASAQLEETKLKTADEILGLIAEVKKSFYTLQALEQFQIQIRQILNSAQTVSALSSRLLEAGNISQLEHNSQKLIAEQAKLEIIKSEGEIKSAKNRLAELLGHTEFASSISIQKKLPSLPKKDPLLAELETIALASRLDLVALKRKNTTLDHEYKLAKWQAFPRLNIGVESEIEPDGASRTGPEIGFQIPLFNRAQGAKEGAQVKIKQNQYAQIALQNKIRTEISESLTRLVQSRKLALGYQKNILPLLNNTLKESQLHYNFMLKGVFDLLQIKREEMNARREYLETLRDYWTEWANLERIVGGKIDVMSFKNDSQEKKL